MIEIVTTAGETVRLDVAKIQFFWQRSRPPENAQLRPPATQIVYQKTVPTDEERIVVEPCLYFDVYKEKIIATTPPNQHKPIEGRAVVETLSTLDEVRQMIKNATPAVEMFETHRPGAYEDDRVFLLYPSEVMDGMQRAIIPFLALSGGYLVRELSIMRTRYGNISKSKRFPNRMIISKWITRIKRTVGLSADE